MNSRWKSRVGRFRLAVRNRLRLLQVSLETVLEPAGASGRIGPRTGSCNHNFMHQTIDDSFRTMAASYFRRQLRQLRRQFDGIRRAAEVEPIHQARVASRRLRAGLRVFAGCFPSEAVDRWTKEIRRVTRGLGKARDRDVQIGWLEGLLDELTEPAYLPGLARVLVRLERKRERGQADVLRALDRFQQSGTLAEMRGATRRILAATRRRQALIPSVAVCQQAEWQLLERLDEFLQFQTCLDDPDDYQRHHAMRIASKRLRYTMEICRAAYGGGLDEPIATMKRLQTLLGDIHDADVWVDYLGKVGDKERRRIIRRYGSDGPLARIEAGIDWLRQECRCRRERLFAELVGMWRELARQNYWDELLLTIRDPRPSDEAGGAAVPDASAGRFEPEQKQPQEDDDQHGRAPTGEPREVARMLYYGAN